MYLHKEKEYFKELIEQVALSIKKPPILIEKDYYVTMILKLLSQRVPNCVFKGGTSLSKGFHVIDRFSEDIDITFNEHLGESRRKRLKNEVLKGISEELEMPIDNWDGIQSDRDYNAYHFTYESVFGMEDDRLPQFIKLETALGSHAFPTEVVFVGNYIGDYLQQVSQDEIALKYGVQAFSMKLQALERTFVDKVFALCDYYIQGKSKRYSRHLYDLYKLKTFINYDAEFVKLIKETRECRMGMKNCPAAKEDLNAIMRAFCNDDFYKEDYHTITTYFASDYVSYEEVIEHIREIVARGIFM